MDLVKTFMGPLDKSYCSLYLVLGFISLFMIFSKVIMLLMYIFSEESKKDKKYKGAVIFVWIVSILMFLLQYFLIRIAYTICIKVL